MEEMLNYVKYLIIPAAPFLIFLLAGCILLISLFQKKKKLHYVIILVSLLVFLLAGYFSFNSFISLLQLPDRITKDWQTVTIAGIGSFRVPSEWNVEEQNGVLYITDRPMADGDYTIYLVGTIRLIFRTGMDLADSSLPAPHEFIEGAEKGETLLSPGFSNGARLFLVEYNINGIKEELHLIKFDIIRAGRNDFELLAWNRDVVDDYIAKQIALTFSSRHADFDNPNVGQLVP